MHIWRPAPAGHAGVSMPSSRMVMHIITVGGLGHHGSLCSRTINSCVHVLVVGHAGASTPSAHPAAAAEAEAEAAAATAAAATLVATTHL